MDEITNLYQKANTLFLRFILVFVFLTIVIFLITLIGWKYGQEKQKLYELTQKTLRLEVDFSNDNLLIDKFFIHDIVDLEFYKNSKSKYIQQHDSLFEVIRLDIDNIAFAKKSTHIQYQTEVNLIEKQFSAYQELLTTIVKSSLQRGFENYGYIGEMRYYAHKLENFPNFKTSNILTLRRHEKDYLIRGEQKYIDLLKAKYTLYRQDLLVTKFPKVERDSILFSLDWYVDSFDKVIAIDSDLGVKHNVGLIKNLQEKRLDIRDNINAIIEKSNLFIVEAESRLKVIYFSLSIILITVSFIFGIFATRHITRPISKLSKNIQSLVGSDFKKTGDFTYKTTITELVILIESYFSMKKNILSLLNEFQQKVEERTQKIQNQKNVIEKQNNKLEKVNTSVMTSIKYARKMQAALLPQDEELRKHFEDFFIIYEPRNIVSGDFFWFKTIQNENINIKLLAVADCTGHGVPGAMMSMLSTAYLNEIILRKEILSANNVLDILREEIMKNFRHDGLDIAFLIIHPDKQEIDFSAANRKLYIKRNNELIKIKGDRMPVGNYPKIQPFQNQIIKYQKGDIIFTFSDGIPDQMNPEGRRWGTKKVLETIEQASSLSNMKTALLDNLIEWKRGEEQTDDIIGFAAKL